MHDVLYKFYECVLRKKYKFWEENIILYGHPYHVILCSAVYDLGDPNAVFFEYYPIVLVCAFHDLNICYTGSGSF